MGLEEGDVKGVNKTWRGYGAWRRRVYELVGRENSREEGHGVRVSIQRSAYSREYLDLGCDGRVFSGGGGHAQLLAESGEGQGLAALVAVQRGAIGPQALLLG